MADRDNWAEVAELRIGRLLIGIIHELIPSADEENRFAALATGNINANAIPGGVAITLGAGLTLISVVVKLVPTTGAPSFGFVSGPAFPLLFIGGGLGAVLHLAVEDIALALAVTAMMAAIQ